MSWSNLKAAIAETIKINGAAEITGYVMQQELFRMVDALGAASGFLGVAIPSTDAGEQDGDVFYFAKTAGTYTNLGGVVLPDSNLYIIAKKNGLWSAELLLETGDTLHGWAQYGDGQYTDVNRFTIAQGATVPLPNNAANVINAYLPVGVSSFYDGTKIRPERVGDAYMLRVSFKTSNNNNAGLAALQLNIGGAQGVILDRTFSFPKGPNTPVSYTTTSLIYSLGTFLENGGELDISSITGTTSIWDISYVISRVNKG